MSIVEIVALIASATTALATSIWILMKLTQWHSTWSQNAKHGLTILAVFSVTAALTVWDSERHAATHGHGRITDFVCWWSGSEGDRCKDLHGTRVAADKSSGEDTRSPSRTYVQRPATPQTSAGGMSTGQPLDYGKVHISTNGSFSELFKGPNLTQHTNPIAPQYPSDENRLTIHQLELADPNTEQTAGECPREGDESRAASVGGSVTLPNDMPNRLGEDSQTGSEQGKASPPLVDSEDS